MLRVRDHVPVGQHVTVGADHEPGAVVVVAPEAHREKTHRSLALLRDGSEVRSSDGAHLGVETLGLLLGCDDRPPEAVDRRLRRLPLLRVSELVP